VEVLLFTVVELMMLRMEEKTLLVLNAETEPLQVLRMGVQLVVVVVAVGVEEQPLEEVARVEEQLLVLVARVEEQLLG
jgi:hypothetical protein